MIAPFPYFGGKSRVADVVWRAFGDVPNYVEPFAGSLAVLLARPHDYAARIETVNDADGMISNFWRATQSNPDEVACWADWPVNEADLHARHIWLLGQRERITERLMADPDFFDAKVAGWWVWGICSWIGSGWCSGNGPWQNVDGILTKTKRAGVSRQLPHLRNAGMGINRQLPHLRNAGMGQCAVWSEHLQDIMRALADRLRRVRVCCGDWSRVCGPFPTHKLGITGVFLDPPYSAEAGRDNELYSVEDLSVAHDVRAWAIANGDNPKMRIALCGYDTEHAMPDTWTAYAWKTGGGYGRLGEGRGRANAAREVIWFSPYCLPRESAIPAPTELFSLRVEKNT